MLADLRPEGEIQTNLLAPTLDEQAAEQAAEEQARLMAAVDALHQRLGRRAVVFGSMGSPLALRKARDGGDGEPRWEMRRQRMTPRYTTRWDELAFVRTGQGPPCRRVARAFERWGLDRGAARGGDTAVSATGTIIGELPKDR